MIRTPAVLLALLLVFAAAPARAQQSASLHTASAPLPALLQPSPRESMDHPVVGTLREGILIGMGIGCVVFGAVGLTVDNNAYGGPLTNAALGCVFGTFVGGLFGFTYAAGREILRPR